jgi:hypothetical protein
MIENQKPNPPPSEKMARKPTLGRKNPAPNSKLEQPEENVRVQDVENSAEETDALPLLDFDANESEFTAYAWNLLQAARRLGEGRPQADATSVRRLMTALMLSGFATPSRERTGHWLMDQLQQRRDRQQLRAELGRQYPILSRFDFSFDQLLKAEVAPSQLMTANLKRTIDLARELARQSRPGKAQTVSARHLLGAAVRRTDGDSNVQRLLRALGNSADDIRAGMIEELSRWGVEDDPEVWRRILDRTAAENLPDGSPNYLSDTAAGPDRIGITREVEAMASLVSAWAVEPPLSIGLFGEWGSGKSFFMQKMKERVRDIAATARKSGKGQREFGYYKNIVQVEFNAWHYVEGNLWASLVEHIFTNLKFGTGVEDGDSEDNIRRRMEMLLDQVKEKTAEVQQKEKEAAAKRDEAENRKREAEEKARRLEDEASEALRRATDAEDEQRRAEEHAREKQATADQLSDERASLILKDVVEDITGSEEIRIHVRDDLGKLGITPERIASAQGLRDALKEASEAGTVMGEGMKILVADKNRWSLLLWLVAGPVVIGVLIWFGAFLLKQQDAPWLQSIVGASSAVAALLSGAVGCWRKYSPRLKPVLEAVERLKQKRTELEQKVEAARLARAQRAVELDHQVQAKRNEAIAHRNTAGQKAAAAEAARRDAQAKQEAAQRATQAAQTAQQELERLQREAEDLLPERRIAAFIQNRAAATDYRQHLGVPALVRRDFEKLAAMFNSQRVREREDQDGLGTQDRNDVSIVNRIILYIDDLDRCPPDKVVEVLRAIHLLLAFPLFVVVVAVDARWMKRSLLDRFSLMLTPQTDKANGGNGTAQDKELAFGHVATSDDYLEKIFQVPFWIRPLSPKACQNLVNALTEDMDDGKQLAAPSPASPAPVSNDNANAVNPEPDRTNASNVGGGGDRDDFAEANRLTNVTQTPDAAAAGLRFAWSPVEPRPRTLQLTREERAYMSDLAPIIGRSPRSVKRFVNCYRLLKSALDKDALARVAQDGTFRTTMLLLGMVTGLPDIAPALLRDLRQCQKSTSPAAWIHEAAERLKLHAGDRWEDLLTPIENLKKDASVTTIRPLMEAADLVERFSFNPVRTFSPATT